MEIEKKMGDKVMGQEGKQSDIENLLDDKYLAVDGEQKVYVLPDDVDIEQLLSSLGGGKMGEIKQSQMWRKTEIPLDKNRQEVVEEKMNLHLQAIDKRLKRLERLLKQPVAPEESQQDDK